jgi:radical SAM-linked protein
VAEVVERAWRKGARFDGWDECLQWDAWLEAIDEVGIDPGLYLGTIPTDARLPWDHLDMQLEPKFLLRDYQRALRDKLSPPCGKPAGAQVHHTNLEEHDADHRRLVCYNCGVACDMDFMRVERREFLLKLRAHKPVAHSQAREARLAKQDRVKRGAAPHDFQQGEPVRVRLQFTKAGADAMTGHLDLVRKVPRILRRAGLPVFYTEGYHPKPALVFGPALALGVESGGELVEVKFTERIDPGDILRRINAVAEEGLQFTGCRILEVGEPGLAKVVTRADYLVKLHGGRDVENGLAAFAARREHIITITRKKGDKEVDLKQVVEAIRLATESDRSMLPLPLRAGLPDHVLYLRLRLDGPQVKPQEVLTALFGDDFELVPVDLIRIGLWNVHEGSLVSPLQPLTAAPAS